MILITQKVVLGRGLRLAGHRSRHHGNIFQGWLRGGVMRSRLSFLSNLSKGHCFGHRNCRSWLGSSDIGTVESFHFLKFRASPPVGRVILLAESAGSTCVLRFCAFSRKVTFTAFHTSGLFMAVRSSMAIAKAAEALRNFRLGTRSFNNNNFVA